MKRFLLVLCISIPSIISMENKKDEPYTGCRYTYFLERKKLPECDHDLYAHFIKIIIFLNAVAKEFHKPINHLHLMDGGQTRQGLFLTTNTPPAIITPWGKWFIFIANEEEAFGALEEKEYWKKVRNYLRLGNNHDECIDEIKKTTRYPLLGYNDAELPQPIMRPQDEFTKSFPCTICVEPMHISLNHTSVQTELFELLECRHKGNRMNLQQQCIKTIKKENLDTSKLPLELQEKYHLKQSPEIGNIC
jgi:hypothetical protein